MEYKSVYLPSTLDGEPGGAGGQGSLSCVGSSTLTWDARQDPDLKPRDALGDSLVWNVFVKQARRPGLNPCERLGTVARACNPSSGEYIQKDSWGTLAACLCPIREFQANERACLINQGRRSVRKDT